MLPASGVVCTQSSQRAPVISAALLVWSHLYPQQGCRQLVSVPVALWQPDALAFVMAYASHVCQGFALVDSCA